MKVKLDQIRVGDRHRSDLGDIAGLADSIASIGLIHPIAVTDEYTLVAGERRLAAVRKLGWDKVPVTVITGLTEASDVLVAERDENTCRKEMTVSELMSLAVALEELERPQAEARQGARTDLRTSVPSGTEVAGGRSREVVAKAIGMSEGTYNRARSVYRAATDPTIPVEERQIAHEALTDIDTGTTTISAAYDRVRDQRAKQQPRGNVMDRAADQRRAITAGDTTLSGIAMGFAQINELHPDITPDEAAQWLGGLVKSSQTVNRLIRKLRERTNAEV